MGNNNYNKHGVRHFDDHEQAPYMSLGIKDPRKWDSRRRFSAIDMMNMGGNRKNGNDKRASLIGDGVHHYSMRPIASGAGSGGGEDPTSSTVVQSLGSECVDHSLAVDSFFASIRVPASFIAATSFTELSCLEYLMELKTRTQQTCNAFYKVFAWPARALRLFYH